MCNFKFFFTDDDKNIQKKQQRKQEKDDKEKKRLEKKLELKTLEAKELESVTKVLQPKQSTSKVTRLEIQSELEKRELAARAGKVKAVQQQDEPPLVENLNRVVVEGKFLIFLFKSFIYVLVSNTFYCYENIFIYRCSCIQRWWSNWGAQVNLKLSGWFEISGSHLFSYFYFFVIFFFWFDESRLKEQSSEIDRNPEKRMKAAYTVSYGTVSLIFIMSTNSAFFPFPGFWIEISSTITTGKCKYALISNQTNVT